MKNGALLLSMIALVALPFASRTPPVSKPLWPGAQYTEHDRDVAVEHGLQFIYKVALEPKYFSRWGHDLLFCFYTISGTARNQKLREMARRMGQERAREWRLEHPDVPTHDPDELVDFAVGAQAADDLLGMSDATLKLKRDVQQAAQSFSAIDFLQFDPRREPPPADIPELCPKCQYQNVRGETVCHRCQTALTFRSPYHVWQEALIVSHTGDAYGVKLGAGYPEVLWSISRMRPYPASAKDAEEFDNVSYAVTHVIYTLNDYHKYRLSPTWLPQEFNYLKSNIWQAERYQDWELLGEFVDALRAFGEDESSPAIQAAMNDLLSHQNPDGSWGGMDDDDVYNRYHSTWTAVDGLRQYSFQGKQLRFPQMRALLLGEPVPEGQPQRTIRRKSSQLR